MNPNDVLDKKAFESDLLIAPLIASWIKPSPEMVAKASYLPILAFLTIS